MYDMPYFHEKDHMDVLAFMREHPFVTLVGAGEEAPVATQVPILIDEKSEGRLTLRGHMMRGTDHHRAFQRNPEALFLFQGPHTYVSASWYSNPQTGSTWNYMTVHARGRLRFLAEPELLQILKQTTAQFENDEASPALFRHLPKAYVDGMKKAIVAFEVEVQALENVFKLSQNRDEQSYETIIERLQAQGGAARLIAEEMRKRQAQLFPKKSGDNGRD